MAENCRENRETLQTCTFLQNFLKVLECDVLCILQFSKKLLTENKTEHFNICNKYQLNTKGNAFDTLALYLQNKMKTSKWFIKAPLISINTECMRHS